MDPILAIFSALSADAGFTALIDTFDGSPAIFSGDALPAQFQTGALPFVWIRPPHSDANRDTFSTFARGVELDVCLYAQAGESSVAIDAAALEARSVLHRQYLPAPSGQREPLCTVFGPFGAPTSEASIAGRRLSARLDLRG